MGNAVWVHSYDSVTQTAKEVQYLAAPSGANPRHLAAHPNGQWVYVIYEEANSLAVYKRDNATGLLTDMNTTYSLLPSGGSLACMHSITIDIPRLHEHVFLLG